MLRWNSVPYSENLIYFEDEQLFTPNSANTTRGIQNTESVLSELYPSSSSYSDTNNVRGSRRRSFKKSFKTRRRRYKRPSVRTVNSNDVPEDSIPEETFTYDDVPREQLVCHVCNIKVSSSQEFAAHLEDVTHESMLKSLEIQFQEEVEELRRNGRAKYERDFKDLGRDHAKRKSRCVMCAADVPESLPKHRRSEIHVALRKYLHPECDLCAINFKTRIEWARHLLMPTHLMKVASPNLQRDTLENLEYTADEMEHAENIDFGLVKEEEEVEEEEVEEEQSEQNNADIKDHITFNINEEEEEIGHNIESPEGEDSRGVGEGDSRSSHYSVRANMETSIVKSKEDHKNSDLTTEYYIDEDGFQVPVYKEDREWAKVLLKEVKGHICRGCKRFFDNEDLANAHCRSKAHFDMYVSLMKRKIRYENSNSSKTSANVGRTSQKRKLSHEEEGGRQKYVKKEFEDL